MRSLLRNKIPFFSPFDRFLVLNLLCRSVKCLERIKSALQRKRSGILLSPATNLLSVRFHIVDKYLHSLII